MAIPSKAYIIRISTDFSIEYAKMCADSCNSINLPWEYVEGIEKQGENGAWKKTGLNLNIPDDRVKNEKNKNHKGHCASASHAMIWKRIAEGKEDAAIILEHDAVMLHPVKVDIPDNMIVALGYKFENLSVYNHNKAGPPTSIRSVKGHEGAHAYAITKKTAQILVDEIESKKKWFGLIDNSYFIKSRRTKVPISLIEPIAALGYLRKSSIWNKSATNNYQETFSESFKANFSGPIKGHKRSKIPEKRSKEESPKTDQLQFEVRELPGQHPLLKKVYHIKDVLPKYGPKVNPLMTAYEQLRKYITDNKRIIHVGSGLGMRPILLSQHFDYVVGFEPNKDMYECFIKNIQQSGKTNIKPRLAFVGKKNDAKQVSNIVNLNEYRFDQVNVLWIDCHYAQSAVLRGASSIIDNFKPLIVMRDDNGIDVCSYPYTRIAKLNDKFNLYKIKS